MDRKSVIQEYYALTVDENGNMPPMHRDETYAGLVAAGLMDLLLGDVITVTRTKVTVIEALPEKLQHLSVLYDYIKEKNHMLVGIMSSFGVGKRINQLIVATGESLLTDGMAATGDGGIFVKRDTYIPMADYKAELVSTLKEAVLEKGEPTSQDMALVCALKKSKCLKHFFSESEVDKISEKIEEFAKDPQRAKIMKTANYVRYMSCIFLIIFVIGCVLW